MSTKLHFLRLLAAGFITSGLAACGGGGDSGGTTPPPPPTTYTVGGTITGLTAPGLVLQLNAANDLTVASGATSFGFTQGLAATAAYAVTVKTQPTGLNCTVASGSGNISANVTNVAISCTPLPTFTVSGTLSGITAPGLVLQLNGANDLTIASGATSFAFTTPLNFGSQYSVTVKSTPVGLGCAIGNASGTITANVNNVAVGCSPASGPIVVSGGITGYAGTGMVLRLGKNGTIVETLPVAGGATSFAFTTQLATGDAYAVTVSTPPTSPLQNCPVTNGSGTIAAGSVSNVQITCTTVRNSVGGTISVSGGVLGAGLILQNNLGDDLPVGAGLTSFQFATTLTTPTLYSVSIKAQPLGQTCTLLQGAGLVNAQNVTNVSVNCVNSRTAIALNGTYAATAGGSPVRDYFTFFADGTYIFAQHPNNSSCVGNGNGVEYGAYNFSGTALTWSSATVDTSNDCGIHDTVRNLFVNGTGIVKNAATGVITGTLVDTSTSPATNIPITLTPVASATGQALGAWTFNRLQFFVVESPGQILSGSTQGLQNLPPNGTSLTAGIEDFCLSGALATNTGGSFTANFTGTCAIPFNGTTIAPVDTNGTLGFSSNSATPVSFSVSGDTMTIGSNPGTVYTRILVN